MTDTRTRVALVVLSGVALLLAALSLWEWTQGDSAGSLAAATAAATLVLAVAGVLTITQNRDLVRVATVEADASMNAAREMTAQAIASLRQAEATERLQRDGTLQSELERVPLLRLDIDANRQTNRIQLNAVLTNFSTYAALAVRVDLIGGSAIDIPDERARQTVNVAPVILPQGHADVPSEPLSEKLASGRTTELVDSKRVWAFEHSWLTIVASFQTVSGTKVRMVWQWPTNTDPYVARQHFALTDLAILPAAGGSEPIELRFVHPRKGDAWGDPWEELMPSRLKTAWRDALGSTRPD